MRAVPHQRVTPPGPTLEMLERCDGKLSRTVLRGERGRKAPDLPGPPDYRLPVTNLAEAISFFGAQLLVQQDSYHRMVWLLLCVVKCVKF